MPPGGKKPPEGYKDAKCTYHPTPEEQVMWKRAQDHYEKTGENLGIFDTSEHADAYAEKVHNRTMTSDRRP